MTDRFALAPLATGLLVLVGLALAGCNAQAAENGITREQGDQIITELKEIRRELAEQTKRMAADAKPADGRVSVGDSRLQVMGSASAPVTMIEYTDYQCPFCKRFHDETWPQLKTKYVDTGKVRYVVKDLPLNIHDQAMPAAVAARCAGQQGQFWQVHEALLGRTDPLSADMIRTIAQRHGVGIEAFERCRQDPRTEASIEDDMAEAERIGVTGTPGFVIGAARGGKVEGVVVVGAQPAKAFSAKIDAALGGGTAPAAP